MAAKDVVMRGIGPGATILYFITGGFDIGAVVVAGSTPSARTHIVLVDTRMFKVNVDTRTLSVNADDRTYEGFD